MTVQDMNNDHILHLTFPTACPAALGVPRACYVRSLYSSDIFIILLHPQTIFSQNIHNNIECHPTQDGRDLAPSPRSANVHIANLLEAGADSTLLLARANSASRLGSAIQMIAVADFRDIKHSYAQTSMYGTCILVA